MKQLKHVEHTLEPYVCSYCNIYNTRSFCNIQMKHMKIQMKPMKHISKTRETYGCKRLVDAELDAGVEFDATE
jgi:hypothetical protein